MDEGQQRDLEALSGCEIFKLIWSQQSEVEELSDRSLPDMGEKAPACFDQLGKVILYLDRLASCWWECRGGDHLVEYLCGRSVSQALAALRLMRLGFYDESLLLCRSMGETANLLYLFENIPNILDEWKSATKAQRIARFSPVKVRIRLTTAGCIVPVSQERYEALSGKAAHITPQTVPQVHNPHGLPSAGMRFQDAGLLICLNEIALNVSLIVASAAPLLATDRENRLKILQAGRQLVLNIGKFDITTVDECFQEMRESATTSDDFNRVGELIEKLQLAKSFARQERKRPRERE